MSTHQVNDAASSRLPSAGAPIPHTRPHLVRSPGKRGASAISQDGLHSVTESDFPGHANAHEADAYGYTFEASRTLGTLAKRAVDIVGSLILALIFSPFLLLIMLMLGRNGGSVIYRHRRVGHNGKMFECLKFRTMVSDADQVLRDLLERDPELKAEWVSSHKLRNDPRITALGRFLRRTSLDELPQIWNVLRGEMSLVGPRPVVREELLRYGRKVRAYLAAKPGITGLWQVTGRNDTDYRRRVALDAYYVRNQSFLLDLYILFKTTGVVLGGNGAY